VPRWTDERNGAYGYNYHFLGNSRLYDTSKPTSFKNWPVTMTTVKNPGQCVAVADCMGTAASFARRREYSNNEKTDDTRYGNEGFNLDPPRVDEANGEMAAFNHSPKARTAVHPRHLEKAAVLWLDSHGSLETPEGLGYRIADDGVFALDGNNRFFTTDGTDTAWIASP
jgi:hypothetical protein